MRTLLTTIVTAGCLCLSGAASGASVEPDNGFGTADLPPQSGEYRNGSPYVISTGLPIGTTIELDGPIVNFVYNPIVDIQPGGALGGDFTDFQAQLQVNVTGTGALLGFNRVLAIPLSGRQENGPRNPGDPVQAFPSDLVQLSGELFGDPDFCTLRIFIGQNFGLPSPGGTTLTQLPSGDWTVDSFFDIEYRIEFQGCPGSVLEGFNGTTVGDLLLETGPVGGGQTDACCLPDNSCVEIPRADCQLAGGTVFPGAFCDEIVCDPTVDQACCFPDGTCQNLNPNTCIVLGGLPQGPFTVCSEVVCVNDFQACCLPDGTCFDTLVIECLAAGGVAQGIGSSCAFIDCNSDLEACCFQDGSCIDTFVPDCFALGGIPQGLFTNCNIVNCGGDDREACCFPDGTCQDLVVPDCLNQGGTPQGLGTLCATTKCPGGGDDREACCFPDGSCLDLFVPECLALGGNPQGVNTDCSNVECPRPVACCFPDGSCLDLAPAACVANGGVPQAAGTNCANFECPRPGACCLPDFSCVNVAEADCVGFGGVFYPNVTCNQVLCDLPTACCCPMGGCLTLDPITCVLAGGTPAFPGTPCSQAECNPCPGDINGDGVVDAADLSVLLGAFGIPCPPAP